MHRGIQDRDSMLRIPNPTEASWSARQPRQRFARSLGDSWWTSIRSISNPGRHGSEEHALDIEKQSRPASRPAWAKRPACKRSSRVRLRPAGASPPGCCCGPLHARLYDLPRLPKTHSLSSTQSPKNLPNCGLQPTHQPASRTQRC